MVEATFGDTTINASMDNVVINAQVTTNQFNSSMTTNIINSSINKNNINVDLGQKLNTSYWRWDGTNERYYLNNKEGTAIAYLDKYGNMIIKGRYLTM